MKQDLKDILANLWQKASVPEAEEDWSFIESELDKRMPVKKEKKRRAGILWFCFGGAVLLASAAWIGFASYQNEKQTLSNTSQVDSKREKYADTIMPGNHDDKVIQRDLSTISIENINNIDIVPATNIPVKYNKSVASDKRITEHEMPLIAEEKISTERSQIVAITEEKQAVTEEPVILDEITANEIPDSVTEKIDTLILPPVIVYDSTKKWQQVKHLFSYGFNLSYATNAYTSYEAISKNAVVNDVLQLYKQLNYTVYCRLPLSKRLQLQPELGLESVSTNVRVNYICLDCDNITRYDVNRVRYLKFGTNLYVEPLRNTYVYGGVYVARLTNKYAATKTEFLLTTPGNSEVVSSTYDNKDERNTLFGLNRNDVGMQLGVEYIYRRLSLGLRWQRGFTDITPETPFRGYTGNMGFRLGWHFEMKP